MKKKIESNALFKGGCLKKTVADNSNKTFPNAPEHWEVFVIKKDETTGGFVGKFACCALARV